MHCLPPSEQREWEFIVISSTSANIQSLKTAHEEDTFLLIKISISKTAGKEDGKGNDLYVCTEE